MSEIGAALQMVGVSKRYPGTLAVDDVDFDVRVGEVHALIGENGAGKSTLMKMLAGAFDDYSGEIRLNGKLVLLHSPAVAKANGIQMIHQELSLAPPLSLAENLLAGRLPRRGMFLDRRAMLVETRRWLARVGLELSPEALVEDLSLHEAQLVEIAKALANTPCILVMDEPTSALSRDEVARLFALIRRLRQQGLAIVYISHHLPEILEIADRVTVMRDGRKVATEAVADVTSEQLVELMVGQSVATLYAERQRGPGETRLRVDNLSRYGFFHDVSFEVRAGEVLGLGGLSGAGRSELARSLCGIDPVDAGEVYLDGKRVTATSYREALRAGFAYLTEDRKQQGLALRMTLAENALSALIPRHSRLGVYSAGRGREPLERLLQELAVTPPDPKRMVSTFSGGNQQKALLAKWLATDPEVLLLDEPTRGVDVGAKATIHKALAEVADSGKCVLLISADLPELVGLADRVIVMRQGHLIGEIDKASCTESAVLLAGNGEGEFVSGWGSGGGTLAESET
ncbi:MAG: ribose ABC transporter ATP-binding protein [Armatimonadetes bacterium CG2_30_66_41]|nr:MAG: ribose ABC transporter ATP-binding protein [Armatimonadetes bacterium CG2_30_66_41]